MSQPDPYFDEFDELEQLMEFIYRCPFEELQKILAARGLEVHKKRPEGLSKF